MTQVTTSLTKVGGQMTDEEFISVSKEMDLPFFRVERKDYGWLIRNAAIRNSGHPKIDEYLEYCRKKQKEHR